jgi:hypothetical protein
MAINRAASPEQLVGGQKKLDVDKDGKLEASDFAALRKGKETVAEMAAGGRVVLKPLMRNRG